MSINCIRLLEPEKFRENVCIRLTQILDSEKHGTNLEKGIYNSSLETADSRNIVKKWDNILFVNIYIQKLRNIYINLKKPEVLEKTKEAKFRIHELAYMSHYDFNP